MAVNPTPTFLELRQQLKKRELAPIYLLHGEEGYYIDELVKDFEALVPESERDFNLYTMYAPEVNADTVMDACRRYPMMAERQVVIVKEAQSVRADEVNRLHLYAQRPTPTTVLVICVRGAQAKAKNLLAEMKKTGGVVFESKKLTERTVGPVINDLIKDKGLHIEAKGLTMLRDYIGTDLSRLYNEINKLAIVLGPGATVTPESIERNIGISKDYNNFELVDALSVRDVAKALRVINYFRSNPRKNPTVMTVASLFNYFSNLLIYQFCKDRTPAGYMAALGFKGTWQLRNYETGARYYNARQSIEIISAIREFDTRSKGIGSRQEEYDLLQDLIFRILTAAGNIAV